MSKVLSEVLAANAAYASSFAPLVEVPEATAIGRPS
jgi:hypothetical protein